MEALVPGTLTAEEANASFDGFKKAVFERALGAKPTQHLGYRLGERRPPGRTNHRNGTTARTVVTDTGEAPIDVPRDRDGSFERDDCGTRALFNEAAAVHRGKPDQAQKDEALRKELQ